MSLKKIKTKSIFTGFIIASSLLTALSLINLGYEKIRNPKYRVSNTLVPAAIIAFYVNTISHLFIYYKNYTGLPKNKTLIRNCLLFLTSFGFVTMLSALAVGGGKFKFKLCVKVYSIALIIYLTALGGTAIYYQRNKIKLLENSSDDLT